MRTVTVLVDGYVRAIEGRQLIPGASADGARHVAGTVTLIQDDRAIVVADPGMVTDRALIVQADDGPYVLTHLWWLEDMTPETDPLAWDQAKLEASRQQVLAIADWIIPGHGRVFRNPRKG